MRPPTARRPARLGMPLALIALLGGVSAAPAPSVGTEAGPAEPQSSQARAYNTTMGIAALRALGVKPRHDPLPVFDQVLKADYKELPAYMTSFFPLAYLASGRAISAEADRKIGALM